MSFYSSGLKTDYVDPVYDRKNFRSEFRLDADTLYLSNLRLLDVSAKTAAGTAEYNALGGCLALIKSIQLLDGNERLDAVHQFHLSSAFKNYNNSNEANRNVKAETAKNSLGYVFNGVQGAGSSAQIEVANPPDNMTTSESTTAKSWIDLKKAMPFLDAVNYLPTNVFKNLRVVVEYNTDSSLFARSSVTTFETIQPLLVVDEMQDSDTKMQLMKSFQGANYVSLENDRVIIPAGSGVDAANPNPTQSTNLLVNGFNNKRVNRMFMVNTPTVEATYKTAGVDDGFGRLSSMAQLDQSVNFRVNGSNLLPYAVDRPNKRLGRLTDVWGTCNTFSNDLFIVDASNHIEDPDRLGKCDYQAANMHGMRVRELQLQYSRTNEYDAALPSQQNGVYNQKLELNLFAEVQKVLSVKPNGEYDVSYM